MTGDHPHNQTRTKQTKINNNQLYTNTKPNLFGPEDLKESPGDPWQARGTRAQEVVLVIARLRASDR
jgi:hypothetical protein